MAPTITVLVSNSEKGSRQFLGNSHIDEDFSQATNLAGSNTAKIAELQSQFMEETRKYDVMHLDPQFSERMAPSLTVPNSNVEEVVAFKGAFSTGWLLYIKVAKPVFRYKYIEVADVTIERTIRIPPGKVTLKTIYRPDGSLGGGGVLQMFVNVYQQSKTLLHAPLFVMRLSRSVKTH